MKFPSFSFPTFLVLFFLGLMACQKVEDLELKNPNTENPGGNNPGGGTTPDSNAVFAVQSLSAANITQTSAQITGFVADGGTFILRWRVSENSDLASPILDVFLPLATFTTGHQTGFNIQDGQGLEAGKTYYFELSAAAVLDSFDTPAEKRGGVISFTTSGTVSPATDINVEDVTGVSFSQLTYDMCTTSDGLWVLGDSKMWKLNPTGSLIQNTYTGPAKMRTITAEYGALEHLWVGYGEFGSGVDGGVAWFNRINNTFANEEIFPTGYATNIGAMQNGDVFYSCYGYLLGETGRTNVAATTQGHWKTILQDNCNSQCQKFEMLTQCNVFWLGRPAGFGTSAQIEYVKPNGQTAILNLPSGISGSFKALKIGNYDYLVGGDGAISILRFDPVTGQATKVSGSGMPTALVTGAVVVKGRIMFTTLAYKLYSVSTDFQTVKADADFYGKNLTPSYDGNSAFALSGSGLVRLTWN